MTWPGDRGPRLIVDDGGDATMLSHRGYQAENDPSILAAGCRADSEDRLLMPARLVEKALKTAPRQITL